jgi:hypothetical protein
MVKELKLFLAVESMMENLRMERKMVKELEPGRMEASMSGNLRMDYQMVKGKTLILVEVGMREVGKKDKVGPV